MKSFKTKIERVARTGLLLGSMAGMLAAPNAFAASGTTSVDIDFPPLLILYYYDNIPITVDAASFATATGMDAAGCVASAPGVECAVTAAPTPTLTAASGSITADVDIAGDATAAAVNTTISFDINNAWGVRSVTGTGGGTLDATFTKGAGEFKAGTVGSSLSTVSSSLTLTSGVNVGDLQFDVDLLTLADATSASDDITITVVPTP